MPYSPSEPSNPQAHKLCECPHLKLNHTAQLQFSHSTLKVSCDPSKNDHLAAAHLVANSKILSTVYTEDLNQKQELNILIKSQSSISYIRCMHILKGINEIDDHPRHCILLKVAIPL